MRFSLLLPTRNGGAFLPDALAAALAQRGEFEVIVADNANTDATPALLASHADDPRVRVVRSERVLTVTENWMAALRAARGDYLLMVGDDDLLLPSCFADADAILRKHDDPDCLTFNAYTYVAPGSFGAGSPAFWSPRHFDLGPLRPERELPTTERLSIVRDMFRFRVRFPLNMQLTIFSRAAVASVPGDVFRAPFPDHFALNSFLLRARRFVVTDARLLVVGVSPKSFGHFFYGGEQAQGARYLGSESAFAGRVEGSELVNSMHAWLEELRRTYPELADARVDRWQYLARQANHWYRQVEFGALPIRSLWERARSLRWWEPATVMAPIAGYRVFRRGRGLIRRSRYPFVADVWPALRPTSSATIADFAAALAA